MLLAITIWIITALTVFFFAARVWWFPESASAHGVTLDTQFVYTMAVTGVIFILAQLALGYFILRYRERPGQKAHYTHGNYKMEVVWTAATAILFYVMVLVGFQVWFNMYIDEAAPGVVQIEVTGQQFAWNMRYPGPDGQFGNIIPEQADEAAGNPLGLDFDDPRAEDDLVMPTMAVPVNQPVELLLRSKDVTHNFSVRELRLKQDTVPGLMVPVRFEATRTGKFEIACSELCGLGHHRMRSFIDVLSQADYEQWIRENAEF